MAKWAKFLISEVRYAPDRNRIHEVKQHQDMDGTVGEGEIVPRETVSSNLKKGFTCMTIHNGNSENWKKGDVVRTFIVEGEHFIRVDKNKVNRDNLGLLVEF
jgi:hypothetical protein